MLSETSETIKHHDGTDCNCSQHISSLVEERVSDPGFIISDLTPLTLPGQIDQTGDKPRFNNNG